MAKRKKKIVKKKKVVKKKRPSEVIGEQTETSPELDKALDHLVPKKKKKVKKKVNPQTGGKEGVRNSPKVKNPPKNDKNWKQGEYSQGRLMGIATMLSSHRCNLFCTMRNLSDDWQHGTGLKTRKILVKAFREAFAAERTIVCQVMELYPDTKLDPPRQYAYDNEKPELPPGYFKPDELKKRK